MLPDHGTIFWPDCQTPESCTYTCSHGLSPGIAILKMSPQGSGGVYVPPAFVGDLVFTDGTNAVTIPDCRVENFQVGMDDKGPYWELHIADRRWRWKELGAIPLVANQLDGAKKFVPWTLRSPLEMATACLEAMGERVIPGQIDMPAGLDSSIGARFQTLLVTGINFPIIPGGINPPVDWNYLPPAQALAQLCELTGRRIIYRLDNDSVVIAQVGNGLNLPDGPIERETPSLQPPEAPDSVRVVGAPTRFQGRWLLEAVGLDFPGDMYKPIDALSYAPAAQPGAPGIYTVTITTQAGGSPGGLTYNVTLSYQGATQTFGYVATAGDSASTIASALANLLTGQTVVPGGIAISTSTGTITIKANQNGVAFDTGAGITGSAPGGGITAVQTQAPVNPANRWQYCSLPEFSEVQPTPYLSYYQAMKYAQQTVFKAYRIVNADPATGKPPATVPGYGPLKRRFQLVLEPTKVDQIVPTAADKSFADPITGEPLILDQYNGTSRDQAAQVYGQVSRQVVETGHLAYLGESEHTGPKDVVPVPFTLDVENQVVIFQDFVYDIDDAGGFVAPTLALETTALVRDADTNQYVAYTTIAPLPGSQTMLMPKVRVFPDVQACVSGQYSQPADARAPNTLLSVSLLELDAIARAQYYLGAMMQEYQLKGGETRVYNGIIPVFLDGAIAQVTWEVGPEGPQTTASRNIEHNTWVPAYPARRRAELLPPIFEQWRVEQAQDLMEQ